MWYNIVTYAFYFYFYFENLEREREKHEISMNILYKKNGNDNNLLKYFKI